MTKAQNIKFLTDLGVPKATAEKMAASIPDTATETPQTEIDEAFQTITTHQNELYIEGDVYKNAIKTAGDKKLGETLKAAEKKLISLAGLKPEEVAGKKYDEIAEMAWKKASTSGDASVAEVQAELVKVSNELKQIKEVEMPALQSTVETEKAAFKIDAALTKYVGTLKLRAGVDAEDALILIKNKAQNAGYKMALDDKQNITFTDKDGNKIKTEDQKAFKSSNDIVNTFLGGQIEKSKADDKDDKQHVIKTEKKDEQNDRMGSTTNHNLDKARKHAESLKTTEDNK